MAILTTIDEKEIPDASVPVSGYYARSLSAAEGLLEAVTDDPGLVNGDPYTGGWFFKLKLANAAEAGALLTPEAYKAQIGG